MISDGFRSQITCETHRAVITELDEVTVSDAQPVFFEGLGGMDLSATETTQIQLAGLAEIEAGHRKPCDDGYIVVAVSFTWPAASDEIGQIVAARSSAAAGSCSHAHVV